MCLLILKYDILSYFTSEELEPNRLNSSHLPGLIPLHQVLPLFKFSFFKVRFSATFAIIDSIHIV